MDAFISTLQSPWAVVIGLVVAVLIGVLIRIVVSSKRRSTDDVSIPVQPQVSVEVPGDAPASTCSPAG